MCEALADEEKKLWLDEDGMASSYLETEGPALYIMPIAALGTVAATGRARPMAVGRITLTAADQTTMARGSRHGSFNHWHGRDVIAKRKVAQLSTSEGRKGAKVASPPPCSGAGQSLGAARRASCLMKVA